MLKNFISLSLVAGMVILAGCGPKEAPSEAAPSAGSTAAKKYKIAISLPAADHGWIAGAKWWAEKIAKEHESEAEIKIQTSADPAAQTSDIETMLLSKPDAMVVLATESAPLTPIAKKIKEQGCLLVNVDRGFLEPVADLFLSGDNKAFGIKAAEYIGKKLGTGNIVILEGVPCTVNTDRVTAFNEEIKKYPGIKVLDSQPGKWNQEESFKVTETMLLKYPKIDAIWSSDDDMSLGAEKALKAANREGVWMLGGGGMKDIVKRVMDGDKMYPATVTYSPKMIGDAVSRAFEMLKKGEKPTSQKTEIIPVEVITPENAKGFYFPDSVY